ncbi:MAG: hypothetical protein PHE48_01470 [Candidatus Daviesbacteria bacterium]|nr:hypothetical protein [Candidatus Daviesbacteria bacterium]
MGCPFAGLCTPCRPQGTKTDSIIKRPSFEGEAKELTVDMIAPLGSIPFRLEGSGGHPIRSEKTCSKCGKEVSTCLHSKENLVGDE